MMGPVLTATWWVAFADGPGGGNPAPIVTDADQLSTEQMQQAAAGFGFETAFVLAPRAGGARRFRYFVPRRELEMCVHATVAAVAMLMQAGRLPGEVTVETPQRIRRVVLDQQGRLVVQEGRPEIAGPRPRWPRSPRCAFRPPRWAARCGWCRPSRWPGPRRSCR
jgi:PhzF family phenazine biosynthesis protein